MSKLLTSDQVRGWHQAASIAGVPVARLRRLVAAGKVAGQKNAEGVYEFPRATLEALRPNNGTDCSIPPSDDADDDGADDVHTIEERVDEALDLADWAYFEAAFLKQQLEALKACVQRLEAADPLGPIKASFKCECGKGVVGVVLRCAGCGEETSYGWGE